MRAICGARSSGIDGCVVCVVYVLCVVFPGELTCVVCCCRNVVRCHSTKHTHRTPHTTQTIHQTTQTTYHTPNNMISKHTHHTTHKQQQQRQKQQQTAVIRDNRPCPASTTHMHPVEQHKTHTHVNHNEHKSSSGPYTAHNTSHDTTQTHSTQHTTYTTHLRHNSRSSWCAFNQTQLAERVALFTSIVLYVWCGECTNNRNTQ